MSNANPPNLNPNFKNLQDVTNTAYITNFPTSLGSKDLWQHCEKYGTVANVYITRKLSKVGRRFAFVRFERKPNTTLKPSNQPSTKQTYTQPKSASSSSHVNPNRSYVNALNGKASHNPPDDKVILKSVTLDAADLLVTSNLSNVVLAKVRDVHLILNINNVLNKEGFYGFQCKYIGGAWLWIEFDAAESCQKLHQNSEMSWYFTAMKHVTHSFKADERIVWIKISGIPLNSWTSKAFKKLLKAWEFARWVPNIKAMESKSSKNSEADNSVDDDFNGNVNDHDPNEAEEGEIHVVNDDHENGVVQDS
nr:RNA-directed DNA polymerase, eukaryota [Tanacetum cinerariifolium]